MRQGGARLLYSNIHKNIAKKKIRKLFSNVAEKIDAFYCIDAQTEAFNVQCLAQLLGKPYIVAEHAPVPWPGSQISDINKKAIEEANLFFAISNDKIRQMLLQSIRLPQIVYIGNMIDETKFVHKKKENRIKTFIIVAAHSFYKNYTMFIEVMDKLNSITDKDYRMMIVGYAANKGYSKNTESFEYLISQSSFSEKTILIPEVSHDKIGDYYNQADAFIMTSIQEGQPVSAMEAACCGLPIFSTRCGGVEDYVDEDIGRIYNVTDVEGMARGLKDFLEENIVFDPEMIRNKVISKFGKKEFIKKFSEAFYGVMNEGN